MTVLVATVGLFLSWQVTLGFQAFTWESYRRIKIEKQPVVVSNIRLENHHNQQTDITPLRGNIIVLNFIYTRCPTICGLTGFSFAGLRNKLIEKKLDDKVRLLSISLDPQYDNPAKLKAYLRRFSQHSDNSWQVSRATDREQGNLLLKQLGVVSIPDGLGGITHNAATHVIDMNGRLVKIIDENRNAETIQEIEILLTKSERGVDDVR